MQLVSGRIELFGMGLKLCSQGLFTSDGQADAMLLVAGLNRCRQTGTTVAKASTHTTENGAIRCEPVARQYWTDATEA